MNQMLRQPLTDSDIRRRTQIFTILDEIGEDLDLTETQFDRARQSYCSESDTSYLFPRISSSASRARRSRARMSSALLVHLNGLGFSLFWAR